MLACPLSTWSTCTVSPYFHTKPTEDRMWIQARGWDAKNGAKLLCMLFHVHLWNTTIYEVLQCMQLNVDTISHSEKRLTMWPGSQRWKARASFTRSQSYSPSPSLSSLHKFNTSKILNTFGYFLWMMARMISSITPPMTALTIIAVRITAPLFDTVTATETKYNITGHAIKSNIIC